MRLFLLLALFSLPCLAADPPPKADEKANAPPEIETTEPVTKDGSVTIAGQEVPYEVTTARLLLKKDDGTPRASVFHVSYIKKDVDDASTRPVTFAFNGGPGSSAVWLHLGILGPQRVEFPGDGTTAPVPPARLVENEFSILDVSDLVFVDPVSTGFSRIEGDAKRSEFHGVNEDIESIGDFVRRWVTEHKRWSSPKYLLGESYGGIRVAGLSDHLQSRYGMTLNGVVLLSSLLDYRTIVGGEGDPLIYSVFLPTYTAVAHHHGKLEGDRDELVAAAREFAAGEYPLALLQGNALPDERKQELAARLSELTSIDAQLLEDIDLRLDPTHFRAELLRDEGKVIGRFDARVAWPATDATSPWASYDPSYSLALGAYSTAMLSYLTDDLGSEDESPYEILTGKVRPWKWGAENSYVNVTGRLANAMKNNPHLRVLVMKAACDLATPPGGIEYSLRQMSGLSDTALERISHVDYEAGHMFYINLPDLEKARQDLVNFIDPAP